MSIYEINYFFSHQIDDDDDDDNEADFSRSTSEFDIEGSSQTK